MPLTRAAAKKIHQTHVSSSSTGGEVDVCSSGTQNTSVSAYCQSVHPLMNDVVLSVLFSYVKPVDLLACRLVCKKWNTFTLPYLRDKCSTISLYDVDHSDPNRKHRGCGCGEPTTNQSITAFINVFSSNTLGIPFTKFDWEFEANTGDVRERKMFLELCGGIMKKISMGSCEVKYITEVLQNSPNLEEYKIPYEFKSNKTRNVVKLFPDKMKSKVSLTKLKTLIISDGLEDLKNVCPTFLKELFDVAQNITTICMEFAEDKDISVVLKIIQVSKRESSIQNLTFPRVSPANLEVLRAMIVQNNGLKLKILRITEAFVGRNDNLWFNLIHLCKDDLVEFYADDDPGYNRNSDPVTTIELPRMIRLKSLILGMPDKIILQSSDFRKCFPVLEELCIEHGVVRVNELFTGNEICPLKSLAIRSIPLEMKILDRIIFGFPVLKKFALEVTEDGIKIVNKLWNEMKQLEELDLKIGIKTELNIDSLVTGISVSECQKISTDMEYMDVINKMSKESRTVELLALAEKHRLDASITTLTKLRRFKLTLARDGEQLNHVSDVTGFLGLYLMKCLKHIRIDMCQFTKLCCETLVADLELESWGFMRTTSMGPHSFRVRPDHIIPPKWYPYEDED